MTKTTTNLIGILLTILAGIYLYYQLCSSCGASVADEPMKEAVVPAAPDPTSYPLVFGSGDYECKANDNYNFNVSSPSILTPLSQDVLDCINGLKAYLSENPGNVINITGYYTSDETNTTAFPNLGLARANAVKNHLVNNGFSSALINTFGQLKDEMVPKGNVLLGPIGYGISERAADADDQLKALYEKITASPLVLYFDTAESAINLTAEQRQKFADISRYLDKVEGATCNVVGHTDDTGDAAGNIGLGQNRADFAKNYMIMNGISEAKINATSKGQAEPVASNDTEEGKAKNRRTVVTLN